ncbi:MAG: hypothetical protein HQK96_10785 [Nitrospirae bacterium]|nr:hypothetical protein [Nitrospirota bacterium]
MKQKVLVLVVVLLLTLCTVQSYAITIDLGNPVQPYMFTSNNGQSLITIQYIGVNGNNNPYYATWQFNYNTLGWDIVTGSPITNVPATGTFSGQYVFDTASQVVLMSVTNITGSLIGSSCNVPSLGTMAWAFTNITATSANFRFICVGGCSTGTKTMTRTSGTAGNITGTWSQGQQGTMTFNNDGTFTGTATATSCS